MTTTGTGTETNPNFWNGFSVGQLADVATKVFTTNEQEQAKQTAANAQLAAAKASQAKATAWLKYMPWVLGIVAIGVVGFFFFRRGK